MFAANIIVSIMALVQNGLTAPIAVTWADVGRIWAYNLIWFVLTDLLKLLALWGLDDLESGSLEDAIMVEEPPEGSASIDVGSIASLNSRDGG